MSKVKELKVGKFEEISDEKFIEVNGGGYGQYVVDSELIQQLASPSWNKQVDKWIVQPISNLIFG